MIGGHACHCKGSIEERKRNWVVITRRGNHSAFNGYHFTRSDYSCLRCSACHAVWRTKANYVCTVPDGSFDSVPVTTAVELGINPAGFPDIG